MMRWRDGLRDKGHPAGVGNSRVYPELRDGYVAVVVGPYESRAEALEVQARVRETFDDAYTRRVTFRPPASVPAE
jgi:hypothetical protein